MPTIMSAERRYGTARLVFSILEVAGWGSVVLGVLVALIGFGTGGIFSSLLGEKPLFLMRIVAALPGLVTAIFGLISVAMVQSSRANVDNAEMTRELLQIARRQELTTFGDNAIDERNSILNQEGFSAEENNPANEMKNVVQLDLASVELKSKKKETADAAYKFGESIIIRCGRDYFLDDDVDCQPYASLTIAKMAATY